MGPFDFEKEVKQKRMVLDIHKEVNIDESVEKADDKGYMFIGYG